MTREEKELLLIDLCARLPYGVICTDLRHGDSKITQVDIEDGLVYCFVFDEYVKVENCHLYLRPMSSITKEEKEELKDISAKYIDEWENAKTAEEKWELGAKTSYMNAEFYNSHHLDWNSLIEKGLAIAVTEENNPYEN